MGEKGGNGLSADLERRLGTNNQVEDVRIERYCKCGECGKEFHFYICRCFTCPCGDGRGELLRFTRRSTMDGATISIICESDVIDVTGQSLDVVCLKATFFMQSLRGHSPISWIRKTLYWLNAFVVRVNGTTP